MIMEADKTTLFDLNIFDKEGVHAIFDRINYTNTTNGEAQLHDFLMRPLGSLSQIEGIQQTIKSILTVTNRWPSGITNGTLMVVEKFYDTPVDIIAGKVTRYQALLYKVFNSPDFSLIEYSILHCFDFIKGMKSITQLLLNEETPVPLKRVLQEVDAIVNKPALDLINQHENVKTLAKKDLLQLGFFVRNGFKAEMKTLLQLHAKIDAWYGMAMAVEKLNLVFPTFIESELPVVEANGLYHLLLSNPVPYNIALNQNAPFIFLTGANMAGKSTFIKAVGSAVFLAHIGMGVPASSMRLSLLDGMLSNINIMDDISKGESYFYNEVQRIKSTINKINNGKKWLILIDELFKGTNVEDAMICSKTVIEGLIKIPQSLFILSTHLYEISASLNHHSNITFSYFETNVDGDAFSFNYQLKSGVSNDRLGYLILKKEGVVSMLKNL